MIRLVDGEQALEVSEATSLEQLEKAELGLAGPRDVRLKPLSVLAGLRSDQPFAAL